MIKKISKKISSRFIGMTAAGIGIFLCGFFLLPGTLQARENVADWYIQDFTSQIVVNENSTLDITETITADCGNALNKHGIFRILPTSATIDGVKVRIPVELISITDQNGRAWKYSQNKNADTVTWQIGDADVTVRGVNIYKIRYRVKNAIRFGHPEFDELYWNLNGNFWDLQTDHFLAEIVFPEAVNDQNATVEYYTGALGLKSKDLATYRWKTPNTLEFESTQMLNVREGITASVIFPKNIFTPYQPTFWEKYGAYSFLLIPVLILLGCFWLWFKYGNDPEIDKSVIAEYEAPEKLSPIEMGMLRKSGAFDNKLITAEIVYLATRGLLTIAETHEKILFFDSKDYELTRIENPEAEQALNAAQKQILDSVFSGDKTKKLSSLKNSFYKHLPEIKKSAKKILQDKGLVVFAGLHLSNAFRVAAIIMIVISFISIETSLIAFSSFFLSAIILIIFSFIMPKRTQAGAELDWKIDGFKLFMETVDKDRAAFYEKENIFERFLPYAIVFGITKEWVKRMKEIYGEEFYASHVPAWYAGSAGAFDADSFSNAITSLSDSIAANTSAPSSSGSGGSGGSGGGGGGGGGGGW